MQSGNYRYARTEEQGKMVAGIITSQQCLPQQEGQQGNDKEDTHKTKLFADTLQNEIGMVLRNGTIEIYDIVKMNKKIVGGN